MRNLVQKFKNIQTDTYMVSMVAALAAAVVTFTIVWLHTWNAY